MDSILIPGAEIYYDDHFLPTEQATQLFNTLLSKCAWERRRTSFGHAVPRDEAYYGDPGTHYTYSRREYKPLPWVPELPGTHYTYSRREYKPLPWVPELLSLKARVEQATPMAAYANLSLPRLGYNAALCNLYRDGNDSVGLHADAEPEMGSVIASVSLGAERLFRLKRKDGAVAFAETLPHGSLLIMAGKTQKNFKHEVPKEPGITQPRINLTFRRIEHK
jgi:alkylated DNA repair dioxygenase AlkB